MQATSLLIRKRIAVAGSLAALAAGCHSPQAVERQRVREVRLQRVSRWHEDLEEERAEHLQWLGYTTRRLDTWRAKTLENTAGYVEQRVHDDWQNWQQAAPVRRAWLRYLVEGRPKRLEKAAIRMYY